ncbi:MAG: peptidoglycan bridge formation glycyltransferase FemA/FemB family protein, partial [bacterium]
MIVTRRESLGLRRRRPPGAGQESDSGYRLEFSQARHDPSWDTFVQQAPEGSHVQTTLWGQVKATEGWDPVRVLVRRGEEIAGGAQAFIRPLPLRNAVAYIPKGPVSNPPDDAVDRVLLEGIRQLVDRYRIRHLSVQPPNDGERFIPWLEAEGY